MISLMQLLKEVQGQPKAIILAGAPGAGKGFILRGLDLGGLKVLNVDNIFIEKLKQANVTLDLMEVNRENQNNLSPRLRVPLNLDIFQKGSYSA